MLPNRRQAKIQAVDGLMKMLGNMDSQRMDTMAARKQHEDDSANLEGSAQLANKNDAHQVLQAKGSDSDINENELDQPKAAPPNTDPTDGDPDGYDTAQDDNDWQPLRDAANRGDSTSRRILELFADEPENDGDETTELEPSADTETSTEPGEASSYAREDETEGDQRGMESAPDRIDPVTNKNIPYRGEASGYVGGDEGRQVGQVGMSVKMPRRRR